MGKKILLVCSGGFLGGAEKLMLELGALFKKNNMQVAFLLNGKGEVDEVVRDQVVGDVVVTDTVKGHLQARDYLSKFFPFPFIYNLFKAIIVVKKFSPEIILVEGKILTQLCALVGKVLGIKVISYVHFPICDYESKRLFYSLTNKIVLCAAGLKKYFKESGVSDVNFVTIRNAVDSKKFLPISKKINIEGISSDTFVISLVGHLSEVKGQKYALQALARLVEAGHSVHMLIAGADNHTDSQNEKTLKILAKQLSVEPYVSFMGKVAEVTEVYHSSDILILPSSREGLPLVILEAMACGLPVIATAVDGSPDAVIDGETGFLLDLGELERGNIEILVEKIEHLLQDRELREKMSKHARESAVRDFSKEKYESEFLELVRNS